MAEAQLTQAAGILLVAGAGIFWSAIAAAAVAALRTGSLPFKDSSSVPAGEFYESIASKPRWWAAINLAFGVGIVVTLLGLALLRDRLRAAGDGGLAELGFITFLLATGLWLAQLAFNLSLVPWAAAETLRTGSVPPTADAWPLAMELVVQIYMVLAYAATALFGAGIVTSGSMPGWVGWAAVAVGVAGALSVVLTGPRLTIPLLIHIVPAGLGIALLLGSSQ